jgi:predicted metal-dependent hydrolase
VALPVEVVRSTRRRKTVSAELIGGTVRVQVPSWMGAADIDRHVAELVPRLERRFRSDHVDLRQHTDGLARRYDLPRPSTIVWTDNQRRQWGSCNTGTGEIRLSRRLADYPTWVLDYVIVHELAHLVHHDHSPAFHELVDRYPRAERARGFLIAKDFDHTDGPGSAGSEPVADVVDEDDLEIDLDVPSDDAATEDVASDDVATDGDDLQPRLPLASLS